LAVDRLHTHSHTQARRHGFLLIYIFCVKLVIIIMNRCGEIISIANLPTTFKTKSLLEVPNIIYL